jgi:hypothetical protein
VCLVTAVEIELKCSTMTPNVINLGVVISTYEFWSVTNIKSIAVSFLNLSKESIR